MEERAKTAMTKRRVKTIKTSACKQFFSKTETIPSGDDDEDDKGQNKQDECKQYTNKTKTAAHFEITPTRFKKSVGDARL